jgi:hypothetical protein
MQMPALRGFSHRNLKNMRQFSSTYAKSPIADSLKLQPETTDTDPGAIGQLPTAQLKDHDAEAFFGISFTHHVLLLNKCNHPDERTFYMRLAAREFWSVAVLEHQLRYRKIYKTYFRTRMNLRNLGTLPQRSHHHLHIHSRMGAKFQHLKCSRK